MRRVLRSIYTLPVFMTLGRALFAMSRLPRLERLSLWLARSYARLVVFAHGERRYLSPEDLANEWNRLMPRPRAAFPVVRTDGDTAFAEIHVKCPLRGSNDPEACWRSMEFDRALMQRAGGRLVVLESQSVTGGTCCKEAIRPRTADVSDLSVAHPRWHSPEK